MVTIDQITEMTKDKEGNSYLKNASAKKGYVYDYALKDNCPVDIKNKIESIFNEPTSEEMLMLAIAELDMQREIDKTEIELAIAELAETLLGGV